MKLELTFLTLTIALLFNTAKAGKRGFRTPKFLGYNTVSVQRHLKIEFPHYDQLFTKQNVKKFMSDCRQGHDYRWVGNEDIIDSWTNNNKGRITVFKKFSVSCFELKCEYNKYVGCPYGEYHFQELHQGSNKMTCEYDFIYGDKKKCYGFSGVGIGCIDY